MRRILYFRVAGKEVHLPKLIGAFILFAALLMFIKASATMFDSWDNLKAVNDCLSRAEGEEPFFSTCQGLAKGALDVFVRPGQTTLTNRQFWSALLGPIAAILFWLAALFVGYLFYKSGELVVPIEETIRDVSAPRPKKAGRFASKK